MHAFAYYFRAFIVLCTRPCWMVCAKRFISDGSQKITECVTAFKRKYFQMLDTSLLASWCSRCRCHDVPNANCTPIRGNASASCQYFVFTASRPSIRSHSNNKIPDEIARRIGRSDDAKNEQTWMEYTEPTGGAYDTRPFRIDILIEIIDLKSNTHGVGHTRPLFKRWDEENTNAELF